VARFHALKEEAARGAFHDTDEGRGAVWMTVAAVYRSPKWRTTVSPALYMPAGAFRPLIRSAKTRAAFLRIGNVHVGILKLPILTSPHPCSMTVHVFGLLRPRRARPSKPA
jgi:hypothetical protein